jgi:hypothetical protein
VDWAGGIIAASISPTTPVDATKSLCGIRLFSPSLENELFLVGSAPADLRKTEVAVLFMQGTFAERIELVIYIRRKH